ncbi:MAG: type IV toxin-antitoxin system AbiEi family antitoxin [Desulfobacterales bacterium]
MLDTFVVKYYFVDQLGNNNILDNIMYEKEIINELEKSLKGLIPIPDLKILIESSPAQRWDIVAKFDYHGLCFDAIVEVVAVNSLPVFQNKINKLKSSGDKDFAVPVLAASYLSPQRQALCRDNGIFFVDLSGNIYIAYKSFFVERAGFPNKYPEKRQRRGPFSDKASLILRELMKNRNRQWGIRELAQKLALDPGYVSRMAKSLEASGYVTRSIRKLSIRSPKEILEDWVRFYDFKKNELNTFFIQASNVDSILQHLRKIKIARKMKYALSVQAGASLVAPHAVYKEVHLYVENRQGIEYFCEKLDLRGAPQGANLVLMLPYYKHSFFYDAREINGLRVVSDIQLYLDLYNYPVRGREQAAYLFDKRLKKYLSVNDNE